MTESNINNPSSIFEIKNAITPVPLNFRQNFIIFGMNLVNGYIKPYKKAISWEKKHVGEINFTKSKFLEKLKWAKVKSEINSPGKTIENDTSTAINSHLE